MERIAVVGLSLSDADAADVEALKTRAASASNGAVLRDLADALAASELVHVETCNRVEIVYAREVGHPPTREDVELVRRALGAEPEAGGRLRFHAGRQAVRHLFRVVSSLDSLVQGEDQVLAQVRESFGRAEDAGMIGTLLGPAFEHAFQVGKQVRTKTELSRHAISVMSLGVQALVERLERRPEGSAPPRLALLGAGEAAQHAAKSLEAAGLAVELVVNRTPARARELAERYGARTMLLDEFRDTVKRSEECAIDILVSATGAPGSVLDRALLAELACSAPAGNGLLALDLALPRDLEPGAEGVETIDLEALRASAERNRGLRAAAAARAEELVEDRLNAFERRSAERRVAERIESYVSETGELLDHELAKLAARCDLDADHLREVERWARSTFGRVTHLSARACKELAKDSAEVQSWGDADEEEETTG